MYNLLIALALSGALFGGVSLWLGPQSAWVPALFVFPMAWFLLARRTGSAVQAMLAPMQDKLSTPVNTPADQQRRLAEAEGLLVAAKDAHAKWQFMVGDQLDNQRGMLRYMGKHFDEALPLLEKGYWRDWMSQAAAGCVHVRQKDFAKAYASFDGAASRADKELMVYVLWSVCASRAGDRDEALKAVSKGLEKLPDHALLREIKTSVANKKAVDDAILPDAWFTQFFPDELERLMRMRGARGVHPVVQRLMAQQGVDPRKMAPAPARPQGKGAGKRARRR